MACSLFTHKAPGVRAAIPSVRSHPHAILRCAMSEYEYSVYYGQGPQELAPRARYAFGGPAPFGTGAGIFQFEDASQRVRAADEELESRKEDKRQLHALVRNPHASVEHLDGEAQALVLTLRAKARYNKFWDLMNEVDRPWHYATVVHLCSRLPGAACQRYRAVKAGTMQRVLASRCKAESSLHECRADLNRYCRNVRYWHDQISESGRPIRTEQVHAADEQLYKMRIHLGSIAADLGRLQATATVSFVDEDYATYADLLIQEAEQYITCAVQLRSACLPHILRYNDILLECMDMMGGTGDVAKRHVRSKAHAELGRLHVPPPFVGDALEWRYPPMQFLQQSEERGSQHSRPGRRGQERHSRNAAVDMYDAGSVDGVDGSVPGLDRSRSAGMPIGRGLGSVTDTRGSQLMLQLSSSTNSHN